MTDTEPTPPPPSGQPSPDGFPDREAAALSLEAEARRVRHAARPGWLRAAMKLEGGARELRKLAAAPPDKPVHGCHLCDGAGWTCSDPEGLCEVMPGCDYCAPCSERPAADPFAGANPDNPIPLTAANVGQVRDGAWVREMLWVADAESWSVVWPGGAR